MTDEQRCGTCRYWDQEVLASSFGSPYRMVQQDGESDDAFEAREVATTRLYGECGGVESIPEDEWGERIVPPAAFTMDGSSYKATLTTQAHFGCTLWAAPDTEETP